MKIHTIGIDLGKTSFHLVGLNDLGEVVVRKQFTRRQLLRFTANRSVARIGMEACGGSHFLGRDVAIKVSDQRFGERFEREARVISSVNHPNICTLHDVGPNYLVMELVEGETLSDKIKQGPIP